LNPIASSWSIADGELSLDAGILVGILNVTPDSFSDGGEHFDTEAAVSRGRALMESGTGIVDVGGESTRPGADPVATEEELRRSLPVVRRLAEADVPVSIDTYKPEVASAALDAGAVIVNDVTGFTDSRMIEVVANADCGVVVMHGREDPLHDLPADIDPVGTVIAFLRARIEEMTQAGVSPDRIAVDPGLGFAKRPEQSLSLLSGIGRIAESGHPVMVGASRKGFLRDVIGDGDGASRDNATATITGLAYERGARLFRVHDVAKSRDALRMAAAIVTHH
jgi:dihydropteroate synthase